MSVHFRIAELSIIFLLRIFTRLVFIFFVTKKNFRIVKTLLVCVLIWRG